MLGRSDRDLPDDPPVAPDPDEFRAALRAPEIARTDQYLEMLSQFTQDLQRAATADCEDALETLKHIFDEAARKLGFRHFTYHIIHSQNFSSGESRLPFIISTYPDPWVRHYFRQRYLGEDPIVGHVLDHRDPFIWSDLALPGDLSRRQQRLLDEARDAGITNGMTFSVGRGSEVAAVSLVPKENGQEAITLMRRERLVLDLMSQSYHQAARRPLLEKALMGESSRRRSLLSPREQEVLEWTAKGKASGEIAMILNLSVKSVEFHLDGVKRKLQVFSRTHAVAKAIMLGLVTLD